MLSTAQARMDHYGLLRWGYYASDPRAWSVVSSADWYVKLGEALSKLGLAEAEGERLVAMAKATASFPTADDWQATFHKTFNRKVKASLHETDYTASHTFQQVNDMADIGGFYKAFGYEPSSENGQRVDHMGLELEFLYLLAHQQFHLEQAGDQQGVEVCSDATAKFLEEHTGRVLERLEELMDNIGAHEFFQQLVSLTRVFVEHDVNELDLEPPALPSWEGILPKLGDAPGCGADCSLLEIATNKNQDQ